MPRKLRAQDGVQTLLTFRPKKHPIACLRTSLEALDEATELPHKVNIVVQGGWRRQHCKGLIELPNPSEFSFGLTYTMNEFDFGDGPVMARSLAQCKSRYWAYLPYDRLLPPSGWDTLFRCMRNEDRRKKHRVIGATVNCVDILEPPRCVSVLGSEVVFSSGGIETREECFAVWSIVNYIPLGPLVLIRDRLEKAKCCFDAEYAHGGHLLDFCMQTRERSLVFLHVDQPAAQLNVGCLDFDNVYIPLPPSAKTRFAKKWDGAGKKLEYTG